MARRIVMVRRPRWSTAILLLGLIFTLTCAASCGRDDGATTTAGPERSVLDFGATGDGKTDDTKALQRAFDAGVSLSFPAGRTFVHSDVLQLRHPGVRLVGAAVLLAVNEARSSVWIAADDVEVDGLTFRVRQTTRRWVALEQMKLALLPHTGIVVRNVTIDGSAAAGIYVTGAAGYLISDVLVKNTRADGIHQTGGAHNGRVVRPVVRAAGDDSVAVVSYRDDRAPCHDITVEAPRSYDNTGGRAFSVVGGHDITWSDIYADRSNSAGLYLSTEGAPYFTRSTERVTVLRGTLLRSNQNPVVDHGAVVVYAGAAGTTVAGITISALKIVDTRPTAHATVNVRRDDGTLGRVTMTGFAITGGPDDVLAAPRGYHDYAMGGWTQNGLPHVEGGS